MAKISVSPTRVVPGDTLTIRVESYDGPSGRVNLQLSFVRVELERDRFAFGSGQEADFASDFEVCIAVPLEAQAGPHFLAELRGLDIELPGEPATISRPGVLLTADQPLEGRAFYIGSQPQSRLVVEEIESLHRERMDRI